MSFQDPSPLLWCMRPKLDLLSFWPKSRAKTPRFARIARPWQRLRFNAQGGFLVATTTHNQSRTLAPVFAGEAATPVVLEAASSWLRTTVARRDAFRKVVAWGEDILHAEDRSDSVNSWANQVALVAYRLASYRQTDLTQYSAIVVATQHDPALRALIFAAQEQGVPVLYVPHAPVADNPRYSDLPVAFAGLRGAGEVAHYGQRFGVPATSLDIVGNPTTDVLSENIPSIQRSAPGVLALSPEPPETLRRIISLIADSGVKTLTVAPHPRSDRHALEGMIPTGWKIHGGPTLEALRAGAPFVIQHSSGVAWEAAALGLPTANVVLDDEVPAYPFLRNQHIFPSVSSAEEFADFVYRAPSLDRDAIRNHALQWCKTDGQRAATSIRELLAAISAGSRTSPSPRILDGWAPPSGPSFQSSWLPEF